MTFRDWKYLHEELIEDYWKRLEKLKCVACENGKILLITI